MAKYKLTINGKPHKMFFSTLKAAGFYAAAIWSEAVNEHSGSSFVDLRPTVTIKVYRKPGDFGEPSIATKKEVSDFMAEMFGAFMADDKKPAKNE